MAEVSLVQLSLLKTASLLKEGYWPETYEHDFYDGNPFSALPFHLVEELIQSVIQLTPSGTLNMRDLYPLLTSGRVKHFSLEDVLLTTEQLVGILMSLSVSGQNLISILLRNVYCSDYYVALHDSNKNFLKSSALDCLISMSPYLESLETCIEFDLNTIKKTRALKQLKLNFVPKTPLDNILLEVDGEILPNCTLTDLYIFEDHRNPVSTMDVAYLLKYCEELKCIENNIARSLEYLHSDELFDGTLVKEYKLQRCMLGSAFQNTYQAAASVPAIHIAAVTCPHLKELDVLLNDHNAIYALSDFKELCSLLMQWDSMIPGDFLLGIHLLLEKIGMKLKSLHILNFANIDFCALGKFCPHLEVLKIEYETEAHVFEASETSFQHLKSLHLECIDGGGASAETLVLLLSNCSGLSSLCLDNMSFLNNDILAQILEKNNFSKVKEATILECGINEDGLKNLVTSCKALEYLHFSSSIMSFDSAVSIVHEINPHVIIRSDSS